MFVLKCVSSPIGHMFQHYALLSYALTCALLTILSLLHDASAASPLRQTFLTCLRTWLRPSPCPCLLGQTKKRIGEIGVPTQADSFFEG